MSRVAKELPDFPVHTPSDNFERKDIDGVRNLPVDIYDRDLAMEMLDHIEECYAEIDRLSANALEWHVVTDDPTTLPAVGRRVIVEHRNSGMTFAAQIDGPDVWALGTFEGERETLAVVTPGDRWAYIP